MFLNIMQISDIPNADIKKTCKTYKKLADVIYFADSFGSLNQSSFNLIIEKFKKNSFINLGIHAHDNMKNALSNTINASKKNVRWLDSTILGMGRGPGNTKTEELINYLYGNNSNSYKQIKKILKEFNLLKIIYKWGTNKYYYIAGKYKIHPTYVQMLLSDSRYKNFNFYKILNNLKKLDTSKFDPNTLYLAMNFFNNNNMINSNDNKIDFKKNIIIFGNGNSLKNKKIFKKKIFNNATRVLINRSNFISPDYVDLVVYCHPLRLIADIDFLNKNKSNILLPYNNIPKMIQSKLNKKKVINFDLKLGKDIRLNKNCIILPKPLSLIYSIGYLISKDVKKIYLAGFDGYAPDDPFVDETRAFLIYLKKNIKNLEIKFLTKSKYKLN